MHSRIGNAYFDFSDLMQLFNINKFLDIVFKLFMHYLWIILFLVYTHTHTHTHIYIYDIDFVQMVFWF